MTTCNVCARPMPRPGRFVDDDGMPVHLDCLPVPDGFEVGQRVQFVDPFRGNDRPVTGTIIELQPQWKRALIDVGDTPAYRPLGRKSVDLRALTPVDDD